MLWCIFTLISCIKLLFIPAYRSTDFEVHRNWLAITHSLPIKNWYYEKQSEWTLDYPPFFAYFEYLLSQIAFYFDPKMLIVSNLNYASEETILFQRLSVIFTDIIYAYGTKQCCNALGKRNSNSQMMLSILLLGNAGLFMVDHIHFQYNGIMFGILLLSIAKIMEDKLLASAFWFAVLLNMKHIYAYIAPVYVIYLLKAYCLEGKYNLGKAVKRLSALAFLVLSVFALSFGPFIKHIPQVLSRLFPFKRGLCHAYWAPNFWVFYNIADKAATKIIPKFGIEVNTTVGSMTAGLVQEFDHAVLPTIQPRITFLLTLLSIAPALIKLWRLLGASKSGAIAPLHFIRCLVLCGAGAFLFGWHVHEKAILMLTIPYSILAVLEEKDAKHFVLLTTIGNFSLFPLLFTSELIFVKLLLLVINCAFAYFCLSKLFLSNNQNPKLALPLLNIFETLYVLGFFLIFVYNSFIHDLIFINLPFLNLMIISTYCSVGIIYTVLNIYYDFLSLSEGSKGLYKRKVK